MKLHPAGRGTILMAVAFFLLMNIAAYFTTYIYSSVFFSLLGFIVLITTLQFFRYPNRSVNINNNHIISPADGKICAIEEVEENEYLKAKCLKVSIFMSPFNVHINWAPVNGIITYSKHKEGKFLAAFKDKAAEENERYFTAIRMNGNREILVNQVAGAMARRILNFKKLNDIVSQNDEIGFIRFGSRVDLYLPLDTELNIKLGDKVTGSQTIIGKLS